MLMQRPRVGTREGRPQLAAVAWRACRGRRSRWASSGVAETHQGAAPVRRLGRRRRRGDLAHDLGTARQEALTSSGRCGFAQVPQHAPCSRVKPTRSSRRPDGPEEAPQLWTRDILRAYVSVA